MAKLYEIEQELEKLLEDGFSEEFVNEDGEIDEEKVKERIEQLKIDYKDKIDGIASYIKDLNADAEKIDEEAKHLKERSAAMKTKAESLRSYLLEVVLKNGGTKIETTRNVISIRKTKATNITNEFILPAEYKKREVVVKVDKAAILRALKEGKEVEGAELVENISLQLK